MSMLGSIISSTKTQLLLAKTNEEELGVISVAQRYIVKMMYTMMDAQEWDCEDTIYALEYVRKFCEENSFHHAENVANECIELEKKMEGV